MATAAAAATSYWSSTRTCTPCWTSTSARTPEATNGKQGQGSNRDGATGGDLELRVPDGTVVLDEDGEMLADLIGAGTRLIAAAGGRGGLGNAALASKARRAPGFALLGEPGEARDLVLELKSVADVGLVGFPVGRQVVADRRAVRRPPEDRRLPVHHAGAEPGRGHGGGRRCSPWPTCPA